MVDRRQRERMKFETDEVIKRAIQVRAGLDGVRSNEVINAALEAYLSKEIADVQARMSKSGSETGKLPKRTKTSDESK